MAEKKITKKEMWGKVLKLEAVQADKEMTKMIEHEIELLNKKKSSNGKPTKEQEQATNFKALILAHLKKVGKAVTVGELLLVDELKTYYGKPNSTSRMTQLLKQMIENDGTVEKLIEKRVSYFKAIAE